jgi:quinol monooxygenase YgiN
MIHCEWQAWNNSCGKFFPRFYSKTFNQKEVFMTTKALFVRFEAKRGKEAQVEEFLQEALSIVEQEGSTLSWYALRLGPSTFGIFDSFPDEVGRKAHLDGEIAMALMERSSELLAAPPTIEKIDVIAAKVAELEHQ